MVNVFALQLSVDVVWFNFIFRSTVQQSPHNKAVLKKSVRPQKNSSISMKFGIKVGNPSIFNSYLCHLQRIFDIWSSFCVTWLWSWQKRQLWLWRVDRLSRTGLTYFSFIVHWRSQCQTEYFSRTAVDRLRWRPMLTSISDLYEWLLALVGRDI